MADLLAGKDLIARLAELNVPKLEK